MSYPRVKLPGDSNVTDVAMTFREIAKALGTTHQNVFCAYASAMKKLRKNPAALALLKLAR